MPVTLKTVIARVFARALDDDRRWLDWPPNAFGVAVGLLKYWGGHTEVVSRWPIGGQGVITWQKTARDVGGGGARRSPTRIRHLAKSPSRGQRCFGTSTHPCR